MYRGLIRYRIQTFTILIEHDIVSLIRAIVPHMKEMMNVVDINVDITDTINRTSLKGRFETAFTNFRIGHVSPKRNLELLANLQRMAYELWTEGEITQEEFDEVVALYKACKESLST